MNEYIKMYSMYSKKYAYAPIRMTACEAFGFALQNKEITEEQYQKAREFFGTLWNYSGE